ncbi:hypothetical protein [Massilia endophytica]|uniref:hypothetical protein n=1 Tax=Massilia endophytica TaxID=2899220 RepID=UPI001E410028|nr:hypothetical protein [Massilia endophytica]UGQ49029.1 hypothetical protein LSQ66_11365 [Massilia endophytica]
MEEFIGFLEWPAMAASLLAAWLVGSRSAHRRLAGFVVFLISNVLWVVWGWQDDAWALIVLNCCLAATNIRGIVKNEKTDTDTP